MGIELRGLAGKNVLITGAARGQGFSHAKGFAEAGCDIAAFDIIYPIDDVYELANQEMLEKTVAAIEERGQRGIGVPCDVRDEQQVKSAVERVLEEFDGRIDVIINNAGLGAFDAIHKMRSGVLDAIIDTNIKGMFWVTKYAVDNMIGRHSGKIINTCSSTVGGAHAMMSHYVTSKHAVIGMTKSWAMELAEFHINVNAVAPATVKPGTAEEQGSGFLTGLALQLDTNLDPVEWFEELSSKNNMPGEKWRVEARHVTDAMLFLASDNADMITGAIVPVDGGQMSL